MNMHRLHISWSTYELGFRCLRLVVEVDYHANDKKDPRDLHDSADQGKKGPKDKSQKCAEHFLVSRLILKLMNGIE